MSAKFINPDNMGRSGGPYTHVVVAGDYAFIAGQAAIDPETSALVSAEFAEEAKIVFENLRRALASVGKTFKDVVKVQAFLADPKYSKEYNEIYRTYFKEPYPARTTMCVNMKLKLEIEAIAYLGNK